MEYLLIPLFFLIGWASTIGVKSQTVRILDVLVYGPFLIWLGYKQKEKWIRLVLYFLGTTTISYNMRNYLSKL